MMRGSMRLGVDLVDLERIRGALERGKQGFLTRVFTALERDYIARAEDAAPRAAGMWAAKEAAVKALGLGFSEGIAFHDITVDHDERGQPWLRLSGRFRELAPGLVGSSLSISHCACHAMAAVLLEFESEVDREDEGAER